MSDWTQEHYVTRNSTTDDPTGYRVWMTCRCGWDSGVLPDGNIPTTHRAEVEHYVSGAPAEPAVDYESRLAELLWHLTDGRMSGTGYDVKTMVQEVEAAFERNLDPAEPAVVEITDEMVMRALEGYTRRTARLPYSGRDLMRAALEAALNGGNK